jgi:hypothetical protein
MPIAGVPYAMTVVFPMLEFSIRILFPLFHLADLAPGPDHNTGFAEVTDLFSLSNIVDLVRRIVLVLPDTLRARVPALGFVTVALRAERRYLIVPNLLDIGRHVLVVLIAVTGNDLTFTAAPGADRGMPGLVRGGCFDPFGGSPDAPENVAAVLRSDLLGAGTMIRCDYIHILSQTGFGFFIRTRVLMFSGSSFMAGSFEFFRRHPVGVPGIPCCILK